MCKRNYFLRKSSFDEKISLNHLVQLEYSANYLYFPVHYKISKNACHYISTKRYAIYNTIVVQPLKLKRLCAKIALLNSLEINSVSYF